MYKLSMREKLNKPLWGLLNNGYRFALIKRDGEIIKAVRYAYQLDIEKKVHRGSKIVRIKDLLMWE